MPDLLKIVIDGGWMMVPLLACSVVAFSVVFERAWAFYKNSKVDARELRAQVHSLVRENRVRDAALLCSTTPGPISAVLLSGLQAYERHRPLTQDTREITDIMDKAMSDYTEHALAAVEKRLYILQTIGNSAPLLGMLGTVIGMIMSFEELGLSGGVSGENAGKVAVGIAVALITTGVGLFIALCAVIPFNWFTSRADQIELEIEESRAQLIDFIATQMEVTRKDL